MAKKKRKNGITAVTDDDEDINDIRKRRKKTQDQYNVQKTKDNAKSKCREIITWMVNKDLKTVLNVGPYKNAVQVGDLKYWFDWPKLDQLSEDFRRCTHPRL